MKKPSGYKYAKAQIKVLWEWIESFLYTYTKGNRKEIENIKKKIKYEIWEAIHENQD